LQAALKTPKGRNFVRGWHKPGAGKLGTIFNGMLSELKYSNYDPINTEFLIQ
jgi:hypothetical protein